MNNPTAKELLAKALEDGGYDGLFFPGECACEIGALAPCESCMLECTAGYKIMGCDCGEGHDWHIVADKP